jgi:type I restriction enzyme S subunit
MSEWPTVALGELVSLEYGRALKANERTGTGEYPVYGSNGVVGTHRDAIVTHPTIVVGRKGAVGEAHLAWDGCWPIDTAFYTVVHDPESMSLRYLHYWFTSLDLKSIAITATVPGLSRPTLYSLPQFQSHPSPSKSGS